MRSRCVKHVAILSVSLFLFSLFAMLPSVKADNPVPSYTISFSSAGELDKFFMTHDFYIAKYDKSSGKWVEDAYLSKDIIFHRDRYYVIAPYFYDDENGYPHLIEQSGVMITLQNINLPRATIIITGFDNSMITIKNVRSHVVIGKGVPYAGNGVIGKGSLPWWAYFPVVGGVAYSAEQTANYLTIRHGTWVGTINTFITISDTTHVEIKNFYITNSMSTPIVVKRANNVVLDGIFIKPPQTTKTSGGAIYISDVDNFTTKGTTYISGYQSGLRLENIKTFYQNGTITINGQYYSGSKLTYSGAGIYANKVGNFTTSHERIDAHGIFYQGAYGHAFYNETNGTLWGTLNYTIIFFKDGKNLETLAIANTTDYYAVVKNTTFVANATERIYKDDNGSAHGYIVFAKPIDVSFREKNETLGVDVKGNYTIGEGAIVYFTAKKIHEGNGTANGTANATGNSTIEELEFYEQGRTKPDAKVSGTLAYGVNFEYLNSGIVVPDNGTQEKEMIETLNATANFKVVDKRIQLYAEYSNEIYPINVGSAFAGLTAIVSVFVAVGWIRVGSMLMTTDPQKKKQGKDMLFKASVGTIIVAFVLFGWANALGVFNWIVGG